MTNTLFSHGREAFLAGDLDFDANTIRITFIDTDLYTYSFATKFYTTLPLTSRIRQYEESGGIGAKTVASGIADGNDCTLSAVSGDAFSAIIIWQDSGSPSTSRLIGWIDTGTGIPASPNGGDITVAWSNGTSKIFML